MEPVIGFALCGSFCTFSRVLDVLERLKTQYPNIIPILSEASYTTDTRFGAAADFRARITGGAHDADLNLFHFDTPQQR